MVYVDGNPKNKKQIKEWLAAGKVVTVFQPGGYFPANVQDGKVFLEGPHYPAPHKWYAQAVVRGGVIVPGSFK
ncbi:MAG: hypothetical protein A2901_07770 [Elusimicrobia bacterium RIFCSPLOWO2_01_FULL_54_10]|nr:MAG: hypothetical protein A2901_07770 [Elusimicrobia bacterium RIFCSPLOWO2_01_FULL_54_10]